MNTSGKLIASLIVAMFCISGLAVLVANENNNGQSANADATLGDMPPNAIPISNAADLALVGSTGTTSGAYPLNGYYYLTNDIMLTGTNNHTPIGTESVPFTGTFDGNGYTISGLNITSTGIQRNFVGLFGLVQDATICNLGLKEVYLSGTSSGPSNLVDVGGIAGRGVSTNITNCYVIGVLCGTTTASNNLSASVGGIIGYTSDYTSNDPIISNCYTNCTIDVQTVSDPAYALGGGIIGDAGGNIEILNSYSLGSISTVSLYDRYAVSGGIIGGLYTYRTATIVNCYYAEGKLRENGNTTQDNLVGVQQFSGTCIIDGTSTPARLSSQTSGAMAALNMRPALSTAQSGSSIYYTGTTTNIRGTFNGWDFSDIWGIYPTLNDGYPIQNIFLKEIEIVSTPIKSSYIGQSPAWSYTPKTNQAGTSISVSGVPWLSSNGTTISVTGTIPTPSSDYDEYEITVTASLSGYINGTQTFTLRIYPSTPTIIPIPDLFVERIGSTNKVFIDASKSTNFTNIEIDLGDGTIWNEIVSGTYDYVKSGLYTITLTLWNGSIVASPIEETILLYDETPPTVAWTMVEYRYVPNIDLDATPTVTITGQGGTPATWLNWNPIDRSVYGTPYPPAAGNSYNVSIDVNGIEPWTIDVIGSITFTPTFDFYYETDGKTVQITTETNVSDGSAMYSWTIRNTATGTVAGYSNLKNPSFTVPSFGLYTVSGIMSANVNGTVVTKEAAHPVEVKDNSDPVPVPVDPEPIDIVTIAGYVILLLGAIGLSVAIFGKQMVLLFGGLIALVAGVFIIGVI